MNDIKKFFKQNVYINDIRKRLWANKDGGLVSFFVGAGFSLNAIKKDSSLNSMAIWSELTAKLCHELGKKYSSNLSPLKIGQKYVETFGQSKLDSLLKKEIPDNNYVPSPIYKKMMRLPVADIFTTNYDTLLERESRRIYEKRYQIIYNPQDIPGSHRPRIIKLHGSFPSHRPFVFTEDDYKKYETNFAPFVNMVRESAMETTLVLFGFSGSDPNFIKWVTWISNNLNKYRPKIYLISINKKNDKKELLKKGITLVDLQSIYDEKFDYYRMFSDLFDYLGKNPEIDFKSWEYADFSQEKEVKSFLNKLELNRSIYPGWLLPPTETRKNVIPVIERCENLILNSDHGYKKQLSFEFIWLCKTFKHPIDHTIQTELTSLLNSNMHELETNTQLIDILLFLINEARMDDKSEEFLRLTSLINNCKMNDEQSAELDFEKYLFSFENYGKFNLLNLTVQKIKSYPLKCQLKFASLFLKSGKRKDGLKILQNIVSEAHDIESLSTDKVVGQSIEGVALYLIFIYGRDLGNRFDFESYSSRMSYLSELRCDPEKIIENLSFSIQSYDPSPKQTNRDFDGTTKTTIIIGNGIDRINSNDFSFYLFSVYDQFGIPIIGNKLKDIFEIQKQFYRIKSIKLICDASSKKNMELIFTREEIQKISVYELNEIYDYLILKIINTESGGLSKYIEIAFRLYYKANQKQRNIVAKLLLVIYGMPGIHKYLVGSYQEKKAFSNPFSRVVRIVDSSSVGELVQRIFDLPILGLDGGTLFQFKNNETFGYYDPIESIDELDTTKSKLKIQENNYNFDFLMKFAVDSGKSLNARISCFRRAVLLLDINKNINYDICLYKTQIIEMIKKNDKIFQVFLKSYVLSHMIPDSRISREYLDSIVKQNIDHADDRALQQNIIDIKNFMFSQKIPDHYYILLIEKINSWMSINYSKLLENQNDDQFMNFFDSKIVSLKRIVLFLKNQILINIPANILTKKYKKMLIKFYKQLKEDFPNLSVLLIGGMLKLHLSITDEVKRDLSRVIYSGNDEITVSLPFVTYDLIRYSYKDGIKINLKKEKDELISLYLFGRNQLVKSASSAILMIIREYGSFFTENDYKKIVRGTQRIINYSGKTDSYHDYDFVETLKNTSKIYTELKNKGKK